MSPALAVLLAAAMLSPPSGRPPIGALERVEPRVYDAGIEVTVSTVLPQYGLASQPFRLKETPIVMPVILQGTFSRVDADSLSARMWAGAQEDTTLRRRTRLEGDRMPHHVHLAVLPLQPLTARSIRWRLDWRAQVWSSRIDERRAAEITWPTEWPTEVQDGLRPQMYIESDDPIFAQTVQRVSEGNLRMVSPYLAAKDLVRYCVNEIRMSGDGLHYAATESLRGLELQGAAATARSGLGGPHDLVCVCVAMLRAAGIPARPVIGMEETPKGRTTFVSWAEFYLPDAGWIPFDPAVMRGKGIRHLDVHKAWPELGTMDDLNRRIPLSHAFLPPVAVESPQFPALWGWNPTGQVPPAEQFITLHITSRGRGAPDPQ